MCAPDFPQNQFFTRFSDSFFKSPQKILSPNRSPGPSIRAFTVPKERDCRERERLGAGARSSPGSIADARRRRGVYSIVPSLLLSMGKGMRMSSYSLRAERVVGGCGGAAGPARPKQLSSSLISHDSVPANAELLNIIQGVPIISTPPLHSENHHDCNLESKFCRGNFRNILSMHCVSNYRLSNCIDSSEEDRTE